MAEEIPSEPGTNDKGSFEILLEMEDRVNSIMLKVLVVSLGYSGGTVWVVVKTEEKWALNMLHISESEFI